MPRTVASGQVPVSRAQPKGLAAQGSRNPVALMVLGMHRSGTSALTRVLSLSGYALPATLMEPAPDNQEGFWESRPIAEFNERVLASLGSAWDDPFAFDARRIGNTALLQFLPEATHLIETEFPRNRSIVIKDPRMTVLSDLWVAALQANGLDPLPIICVRHPLEVAASLARRNGTPMNRACLTWLSYQLSAERATRAGPRAFVLMEDLMSDWRTSLNRIEAALGISLERRDPEAELLIERALKPELVHHRTADGFARANRNLPDWAAGAYTWFEAMARSEPADQALLERATETYEAQRKWFGPILADANLRLADARAEHAREVKSLEARLLETVRIFEQQQAGLEQQVRNLEAVRAALDADLSELRRRTEQDRAGSAAEISALSQAMEAAQRGSAALESKITGLEEQAKFSTARISSLHQELERALEMQHDLIQQRQASEARAADLSEEVRRATELQRQTVEGYEQAIRNREAEISGQLSHAQSVITDLEAELLRDRQMVRQRTLALDTLSAQHHAVLSSTAWRMTRPLRALGARMPAIARAIRGIFQSVTGRPSVPATAVASHPASQPVTLAVTPAPAVSEHAAPERAKVATIPAFDPGPVAAFIEAETREASLAENWKTHCRQFPVPYDPASGDKAKTALSDTEAAQWIERCRAAGRHLPPVSGQPDASIIIPVYNQLAFTLSAIAAVYALRTKYSYEILIADDCSNDQTHTLNDGDLPRVRMVRQTQNLGFLRNCNEAACAAKGRIIILLNNDTVVLPGWLDGLVQSLDNDPEVGFAGSRLLFPDGKLQEAGGLVWQDGSAWNFGRGQDPRDPRFSYAREVDYISGASIALPADLWHALGGFDAATYDVAYYEDVDLAFRVRQAGRKVLYQPRSSLVHFEGVSSGTDLTKGVKQYQKTNGERFFARWQEVLQAHLPNGVKPEQECERRIRKRMLVIDSVTPTPDKDAGSLVMMEMLRAFQKDAWRISFVPEDNFAYLPDASPRLQREGMEALYWPYYKSIDDILRQRGQEFDIILISRITVAAKHLETVRRLAPHAKVIFNTVDLHYLREAREAEVSGDPEQKRKSERTKAAELRAANWSDLVIVHSTVEREILSREAPSAKVYVFPWVAETRSQATALADRESVLFIGGFRHPPNVDAVSWLVSDIWPRVREAVPGAKLRIVGPDAPDSFAAFDGRNGIRLVGWVPELEPELDKARITVAPLRFGAGIKGKVISSISSGVPVVCTPVAAEGMGVKDAQEVLIAADAAGFADGIIRLLTDDADWHRLSRAGAAFVDANYSRAAALGRIREMVSLAGG